MVDANITSLDRVAPRSIPKEFAIPKCIVEAAKKRKRASVG
jgi:hypothetical protein